MIRDCCQGFVLISKLISTLLLFFFYFLNLSERKDRSHAASKVGGNKAKLNTSGGSQNETTNTGGIQVETANCNAFYLPLSLFSTLIFVFLFFFSHTFVIF